MAAARQRRREYWAGASAVVLATAILLSGAWPVPVAIAEGSVLDAVFRDRVIVGMLRLAVGIFAMYSIASVPALIVGGRWAKSVGTTGVLADDSGAEAAIADARREIAALKVVATRLEKERDEWAELVDRKTRPN